MVSNSLTSKEAIFEDTSTENYRGNKIRSRNKLPCAGHLQWSNFKAKGESNS
jgi:hypothetical protein